VSSPHARRTRHSRSAGDGSQSAGGEHARNVIKIPEQPWWQSIYRHRTEPNKDTHAYGRISITPKPPMMILGEKKKPPSVNHFQLELGGHPPPNTTTAAAIYRHRDIGSLTPLRKCS